MDAPATIHRRAKIDAVDTIVAHGPLVIMAHGLLALAPSESADCWIRCEAGDLSVGQAETVLNAWLRPH